MPTPCPWSGTEVKVFTPGRSALATGASEDSVLGREGRQAANSRRFTIELEPDDASLLCSLENLCKIGLRRHAVARRAYVYEASKVGGVGALTDRSSACSFCRVVGVRWVSERAARGSASPRNCSMQWVCMFPSLCGNAARVLGCLVGFANTMLLYKRTDGIPMRG